MRDCLHLHKRKRIYHKYEKYPNPNPKIRFLDNLIMLIAVIFPFTTLPQIYKIWVEQNAAGVSVITWTLYFIFSIPFLLYGIVHKEKPLIVMYSLWLFVDVWVIAGSVLYG